MPAPTKRLSFHGESYAFPTQRRLTRDVADPMGPKPGELETPRALAGMVKGALGIDQRTRDDTAVGNPPSVPPGEWPGPGFRQVAELPEDTSPLAMVLKNPE